MRTTALKLAWSITHFHGYFALDTSDRWRKKECTPLFCAYTTFVHEAPGPLFGFCSDSVTSHYPQIRQQNACSCSVTSHWPQSRRRAAEPVPPAAGRPPPGLWWSSWWRSSGSALWARLNTPGRSPGWWWGSGGCRGQGPSSCSPSGGTQLEFQVSHRPSWEGWTQLLICTQHLDTAELLWSDTSYTLILWTQHKYVPLCYLLQVLAQACLSPRDWFQGLLFSHFTSWLFPSVTVCNKQKTVVKIQLAHVYQRTEFNSVHFKPITVQFIVIQSWSYQILFNKFQISPVQTEPIKTTSLWSNPLSWACMRRLWKDGSRSSLTISFIKKESFQPDLKGREGVCFLKPNSWFQEAETSFLKSAGSTERGLITEGSASHSAFRNSGNHKETCNLGAKSSVGEISNYEIFKIWWSSVIKSFIGEEKNIKFYSEFNREPMNSS